MKASLRFEHTPRAMKKIKRRRRKKVKSPDQPVAEVVNVQEEENPVTSKWVSIILQQNDAIVLLKLTCVNLFKLLTPF